jgi:hypothetical protein
MLRKSGLFLLALLLLLQLGLEGCGKKDTNIKTKAYANDGLLGTTNGYPNFPTNPSFHTYANDKSLVLKALSPIKGIRRSRISFRGADLIVNLDLEPATDIETAMQIKYAALGSVGQMMPRYRVKVIVGKSS